jgi:hypothetical protein
MSVTISAYKRWSVRLYLQLFVGGPMSYCVFLCLRMLVSNRYFVVFVFVLLPVSLNCPFLIARSVFYNVYLFCFSSCCQFLWIVHSWLPVRSSITFICKSNKRYRIPNGQSRMDNSEKLATWRKTKQINVIEYRTGNQEWTIQRNW